jgi:hypothetical protein
VSFPERPIRRARRRAPGAAVATLASLGLALAAAPAVAQVGPRGAASVAARTISLYPVTGRGELDGDAADVQSLLDAALHRVAQRSGDVVARDPLLLRPSCGPARSATAECLAQLAGNGVVVRATVRRAGNALIIAVHAVDGAAQSHGPVSAGIDAYVQSAEPLANAVLLLVDQAVAAERRRRQEGPRAASRPPTVDDRPAGIRPSAVSAPRVASAPRAPRAPIVPIPRPPSASRPEERAPAGKPDLSAAEPAPKPQAVAAAPREDRPAGAWMRPTGRWMTGAGVALLAGGIALSTVNRSASDELDGRFEAGTLTPGDLSAYRRVDRANTLTAALFATGGAFTLAGVALWTAPPVQGRVVAGVAGRF